MSNYFTKVVIYPDNRIDIFSDFTIEKSRSIFEAFQKFVLSNTDHTTISFSLLVSDSCLLLKRCEV